jgi:hypothetical protein
MRKHHAANASADGDGADECDAGPRKRGRRARREIRDLRTDQRVERGRADRRRPTTGPKLGALLRERAEADAGGYRKRVARRRVRGRGEACGLGVELSDHHR